MDDGSKRIRKRLKTQTVDPHRVRTQRSTYLDDFQRKNSGETDIAELFHENTKVARVGHKFRRSMDVFSNEIDTELTTQLMSTAARNDLETIALPEPVEVKTSITETIRRRRSVRNYSGAEISLERLSTILKYGCGTLRSGDFYDSDERNLRGYPSAGGLYPIEPYLVVSNVSGLSAGIYYYSAANHELRVIRRMDREQLVADVESKLNPPKGTKVKNIAFAVLLTGAFWKTKVKYGPRGYRFALFEAGHLAQNVQLVSASLGLGSCGIGGTKETELDPLIGVNGVDESTVYGFVVGHPGTTGESDE